VHKLSIVLKELKETRYWLRVIHRNGMLAAKLVEPVINEREQLFAIVGKSISTAKKGKRIQ
jgi:four helix bundle protein